MLIPHSGILFVHFIWFRFNWIVHYHFIPAASNTPLLLTAHTHISQRATYLPRPAYARFGWRKMWIKIADDMRWRRRQQSRMARTRNFLPFRFVSGCYLHWIEFRVLDQQCAVCVCSVFSRFFLPSHHLLCLSPIVLNFHFFLFSFLFGLCRISMMNNEKKVHVSCSAWACHIRAIAPSSHTHTQTKTHANALFATERMLHSPFHWIDFRETNMRGKKCRSPLVWFSTWIAIKHTHDARTCVRVWLSRSHFSVWQLCKLIVSKSLYWIGNSIRLRSNHFSRRNDINESVVRAPSEWLMQIMYAQLGVWQFGTCDRNKTYTKWNSIWFSYTRVYGCCCCCCRWWMHNAPVRYPSEWIVFNRISIICHMCLSESIRFV